jgi:hypothetical protein
MGARRDNCLVSGYGLELVQIHAAGLTELARAAARELLRSC